MGKGATEEKQETSRSALTRVLRVGLLASFVVLALTACGGGSAQDEVKAHKIPEDQLEAEAQRVPPGEYVSGEFRPTMSFRLDEGWTNWEPGMGPGSQPGEIVETRDSLSLFT